jgi:hypothetical protein
MPRRNLRVVLDNMVAKMECMWKPAQSGKTRTIQQMIREDDGVRNHLNIVICSNNRLLVAQTRTRMHNDLYVVIDEDSVVSSESEETVADDAIVGGVYSWMSGTKKSNISMDALAWKVFRGEVSMIVCCSHSVRFRSLNRLLAEFDAAGLSKPVNVWIDEADVSVKTWSDPAYDFAKYTCVRKVTLVSATFDEVFKYYRRIRVKAFPETHPDCYRGLKDCDLIREENHSMEAPEFLDYILYKYRDTIVRPGVRLFAPGDITVESHEKVAEHLRVRGFAVLMLNGQEKGFRMPDGTLHEIVLSAGNEQDPDELSRVIAAKYVELDLARFPFAVTGHLCLSRGITFQSARVYGPYCDASGNLCYTPGFLFDYGILPEISNSAAAYQCVARVLGNIGDFSMSKATIYTSHAMADATMRQERIAINLARLVHENEWVEVGLENVAEAAGEPCVTNVVKAKLNEDDYDVEWHEFGDFDEVKKYAPRLPRPKKKDDEEFYMSSTTGKAKRLSYANAYAMRDMKKTAGFGVSVEKPLDPGKSTYTMYVCYYDINDKNSVCYIVGKLTRKSVVIC